MIDDETKILVSVNVKLQLGLMLGWALNGDYLVIEISFFFIVVIFITYLKYIYSKNNTNR